MKISTRTSLAVVACTAAVFSVSACGSSSDDTAKTSSGSSTTKAADPAAQDLVGSGCAAYAKANASGPASVDGMASAKVAAAASANPLLKTLVAAVSGGLNPAVNLVPTLNGGEFTVFAPVDDAFTKLPAATVATLKTPGGAATLTKVLTYHVIAGQLSPSQIDGTHKTVEGGDVTVTGSGDDITVGADHAKVICGGVHTANATVYLIDSVLMPPS
jgi:uncharacterized surface protein with fasciclin (FAS1) repeats